MAQHDNSYKLLFSHPEMVRDLLVGFINEPWVAELDLSTLEKANGSYVADNLRDREDDVIWRVRFRDRWIYLYLLLEFQSKVDDWMPVRILTYLGLLYQDLINQNVIAKGEKLPPVLPRLNNSTTGRIASLTPPIWMKYSKINNFIAYGNETNGQLKAFYVKLFRQLHVEYADERNRRHRHDPARYCLPQSGTTRE